jgi:hypothetical protein
MEPIAQLESELLVCALLVNTVFNLVVQSRSSLVLKDTIVQLEQPNLFNASLRKERSVLLAQQLDSILNSMSVAVHQASTLGLELASTVRQASFAKVELLKGSLFI